MHVYRLACNPNPGGARVQASKHVPWSSGHGSLKVLFDSSLGQLQMTLTWCVSNEEEWFCVCGSGWRPGSAALRVWAAARSTVSTPSAHAISARLLKNRKTTARITSPRGWINQVSIHKSLESTWRMSMFAQEEKKTERHLKIYIYSESVRDQTAKLIFSSLNACSAPSLQFHYSPSIDFPHGPSPWRLQAGPLSPLLRP